MWNWVAKLQELHARAKPFAIVTVTRCTGSTPRETGAKMIVESDGRFHGTIGGGRLEKQAIEDALRCIAGGGSKAIHYPLYAAAGQCCGGVVDLLMEVMNQNPRLYLFGAGHVAQALCQTLSGTPFEVHVIDEREEWVNSERLPREVARHGDPWRDFISSAEWDPARSYVAIMTHQHDLDQDVLEAVLSKPARYVGMIGSQSKWSSFQQRLLAAKVPAEALARVRCPIGIPVGGKAPQEVAISIAAELLKVHYGQ